MKKVHLILATILMVIVAGCGKNKESKDALITVNITANYPEKELILQDILDVEYILLETSDEFITQGYVRDIGKGIIQATNRINDGDIFIFDRKTGKGLGKINRKGQGGEEYSNITGITLDEDNGEMFVNTPAKKILVYDLSGQFKRSFKHSEGSSYSNIFNYDRNNLICYDMSDYYKDGEDRGKSYHVIISKQDGSVTREIKIPFQTIVTPVVRIGEGTAASSVLQTIPYRGNWLLVDTSSDTVYNYVSGDNISPFMVRTPSIRSMDTKVFLSLSILTDRYYFMKTLKNEFNFEIGSGFPSTDLMYDKQEKALFKYTVYNGDYTEKRPVSMNSKPMNSEIAFCQTLEAYQLVEDYKKGILKGKLKDIAAKMDEDSNPVIMLVKHKK